MYTNVVMRRAVARATRRNQWRTFASSRPSFADAETKKEEKTDDQAGAKQGKQQQQRDTTVEGRSPFQAFVDVLREEVRKNREWQESVAQLQGEASKVQDSEAMKRAKDLYERARLRASIQNNPKLKAAADELRKAGIQVNDAVTHALKGMEDSYIYRQSREALQKAGKAAYDASEPIRQTEVYKTVAAEITEALDDAATNVQHGGYIEREDRIRRRKARLAKVAKANQGLAVRARRKVEEDPDAGENVVLHATANVEKKSKFASIAPQPVQDFVSNLSNAYAESENPVVSSMRSVTGFVGRIFQETETAKVVKWVKEMDPSFTFEGFGRELREYIVPEIVDAFINVDQPTLRLWSSEATYNVIMASLDQFAKPHLLSESRVLDIRSVDIMRTKILENDINVFVVAWRTQEIIAFRDVKTGEIAAGDENKIEQVGYVAVFTRLEEEIDNEETGGWKMIDFARRAG